MFQEAFAGSSLPRCCFPEPLGSWNRVGVGSAELWWPKLGEEASAWWGGRGQELETGGGSTSGQKSK